jgi:hypothetical protein
VGVTEFVATCIASLPIVVDEVGDRGVRRGGVEPL